MSEIKKLANQTIWYGVPTIASRFLGYLMNLSLPLFFAQPATTADLTQIYAMIPFLNVLFTYGLETAYFRFIKEEDPNQLYSTLSISLLGSTLLFSTILWLCKEPILYWANLEAQPAFMNWMIGILFFDTISTLAFARLRQENRPRKYAAVRLSSVLVNFVTVLVFIGWIPQYVQSNPSSPLRFCTEQNIGIGYYLIGNLAGSILTFLLLFSEFRKIKWDFHIALLKKVLNYTYPLIIVGMGGMVNDMLSRLIYQHVVDLPVEAAKHELAIFGNIYRLAVLITIMIQAFRMAAEPFFFKQKGEENAQKIYARVMKFFVIACSFMLLFISLFIEVFEWFFVAINKPLWTQGLQIVPLLALGNIFLGIYYNLSIWYKLTDRNNYGALITVGGAIITIILNIILIPSLHYLGAAIATFLCYLFMMLVSYHLGQKFYPVPYATKKLIAYLVIVLLMYIIQKAILYFIPELWLGIITGIILIGLFGWLVYWAEEKELRKLVKKSS
ncbi:lipopolysaccharide biosynthesis protein [Sediminibacterium sp. TEGAF015]|uniref:lipopolysaccharide biosynthesis protein n=1 Tax=Sediminibacterium sp. TEGAF015 TaxID=575378 RepID=UPI0021FC6D0D|nr:polysaccharide biosynthesis C-terminal domain-containing protein [Sediminibacterium sp. TEGAF015]BDQ12236.1 polysaccharide biosynthesis protein [Sediminibacterium sp. TEGAF015]